MEFSLQHLLTISTRHRERPRIDVIDCLLLTVNIDHPHPKFYVFRYEEENPQKPKIKLKKRSKHIREDEGRDGDTDSGESSRNYGESRRVSTPRCIQRGRCSSPHGSNRARVVDTVAIHGSSRLLSLSCLHVHAT